MTEADLVGGNTQDGLLEDGEGVAQVRGVQLAVAGQEAGRLVLAAGAEADLGVPGGTERRGERGVGQVAVGSGVLAVAGEQVVPGPASRGRQVVDRRSADEVAGKGEGGELEAASWFIHGLLSAGLTPA